MGSGHYKYEAVERSRAFGLSVWRSYHDSQRQQCASISKTSRLVMYEDVLSVYGKRGMEHVNTICGEKCSFLNFKTCGICNNPGG
jgi:hypothetical protein